MLQVATTTQAASKLTVSAPCDPFTYFGCCPVLNACCASKARCYRPCRRSHLPCQKLVIFAGHGVFVLRTCKRKPAIVPARSMTTPIATAELPPRMRRSSRQRTVWLQHTGLFRFRVDTIIPNAAKINQHPILSDNSAPPLDALSKALVT